jgi:histidinol dehydrogenase
MLEIIKYPSRQAEDRLSHIATRKVGTDSALERQVLQILEAVKERGDSALVDYTRKFDAPGFDAQKITVSQDEIEASYNKVDTDFLAILKEAAANIEAFHRHQLRTSYFITRPDGTFLGQIVRPVDSAGLYIPGGKGGETPLISSTLMNAIPACLAGVQDIALVTPPRHDGTVNPYLLVAARETGVTRIHKVGSAWAIAALAYGTTSIPRTDIIVGPGNVYVTLAKKLLSGQVGIDLLAGPSEILILADRDANPDYLAADLLSQAEHDPTASAVLITNDSLVAEKTLKSLDTQLNQLPRNEIAREALKNYGAFFLVADMETAVNLANLIAPEHLEMQIRDPWGYLGKIAHAGAVFLGEHTPEAVGDYFAGSNHVLPTAGTARFASALGVENFLKRTSVVAYSRSALQRDARAILRLAEIEGLEAHAASVRIRLED